MGRKANFAEKQKKGPGRKTKKQKDPVFINKKFGKTMFIFFNLKIFKTKKKIYFLYF